MVLNSFKMFVSKCISSEKPLKVTSSEEPLGHRVPSLWFKDELQVQAFDEELLYEPVTKGVGEH